MVVFILLLIFDTYSLNRLAYENAKDIIAIGFDPKKTFMFSDLDYVQVITLYLVCTTVCV